MVLGMWFNRPARSRNIFPRVDFNFSLRFSVDSPSFSHISAYSHEQSHTSRETQKCNRWEALLPVHWVLYPPHLSEIKLQPRQSSVQHRGICTAEAAKLGCASQLHSSLLVLSRPHAMARYSYSMAIICCLAPHKPPANIFARFFHILCQAPGKTSLFSAALLQSRTDRAGAAGSVAASQHDSDSPS